MERRVGSSSDGWTTTFDSPRNPGADAATVKLDRKGEPQPDGFLFIPAELGGSSAVDEEGYLTGAPELVAEVVRSSCAYDLNEKKTDYERAGVREYLVVELEPNRIPLVRPSWQSIPEVAARA